MGSVDDTAIIVKTQQELQDMVNKLVDTARAAHGKQMNNRSIKE